MSSIPSDAWPVGDRTTWDDDATRTHHDFLHETVRPYTAAENAAANARAAAELVEANGTTLRSRAAAALAVNREFSDLTAPTNAQTLAHVKHLTRVVNALIRLEINDLSDTN